MGSGPWYGPPRIVVRRYRALIGALGAVGLCAGITLAALHSSMPSASTVVLLPPSSSGTSSVAPADVYTQELVATSTAVLAPAGASISPPVTANQLAKRVKVKALGHDLMSFRAVAPDVARAVLVAKAVAAAYVRYTRSHSLTPGPVLILGPATGNSPKHSFLTIALAGLAGLIAGLGLGCLVLLNERRVWRGVQLI